MLMNNAPTPGAPDTAYAGHAPERKPATSSPIEVIALRGRRDRNRFVDLPYRLHRNDPNWVPPLRRDMHRLLDRKRNPFFLRQRRRAAATLVLYRRRPSGVHGHQILAVTRDYLGIAVAAGDFVFAHPIPIAGRISAPDRTVQ